jgi:hypothetical protein
MTSLSDQFILLDKLRQSAGIAPDAWCRKAGVIWLRYLKGRFGVPFMPHEIPFPTQAEIEALTRALERTADDAISPRHPVALPSRAPVAARPESKTAGGRG